MMGRQPIPVPQAQPAEPATRVPMAVNLKSRAGGLTEALITNGFVEMKKGRLSTFLRPGLAIDYGPGTTGGFSPGQGLLMGGAELFTVGGGTLRVKPNKLTFTVQPSNVAPGASIFPAVKVALQNSAGSTLTYATDVIILGLLANPGGSTLSGTLTGTAVAGVATFNNLSLDKVGVGYTLEAGIRVPTLDTFVTLSRPRKTSASFDVLSRNYVQQYQTSIQAEQMKLLTMGRDGSLVSVQNLTAKSWWVSNMVLLAVLKDTLVFSNTTNTYAIKASDLSILAGPIPNSSFGSGTALDFCSNASGGFYWTNRGEPDLKGTCDSLLANITSASASLNGWIGLNRYQDVGLRKLHRGHVDMYELYDPTNVILESDTILYSSGLLASFIAGLPGYAGSPVTDLHLTKIYRAITAGAVAKLEESAPATGVQSALVTLYTASAAVRWHGISADETQVMCVTRDAAGGGTSNVKAFTVAVPGLAVTDVSVAVQASITAVGGDPTSQLFQLNRGY